MNIKTNPNKLIIKGASQHNLKSINLSIPHNSLTVVTGVSGSGKSSLVFDTIFAEGQRRYVESLSSYARQFLGRMPKPNVESIEGLAPAIAIEQKVITRNPRSTVATTTEIYDYLKLLFARIGKTIHPISGKEVKKNNPDDIAKLALKFPQNTILTLLAKPEKWNSKQIDVKKTLDSLKQQGFIRLWHEGEIIRTDKPESVLPKTLKNTFIIIDRIILDKVEEDTESRIRDSAETAFWEGNGFCKVEVSNQDGNLIETHEFSDKFEMDGIEFTEPSVNLFSFNNPVGACVNCGGLGEVVDIDPELVIPDESLSVYQDCVLPWKSESMLVWKNDFMKKAVLQDFPIHRSYGELTPEQKDLLWNGNKKVNGIKNFFEFLESKTYKIQYRVMLSRYRGKTVCQDCKGTKLRKDAGYVKIIPKKSPAGFEKQISLHDILVWQVNQSRHFFNEVEFSEQDSITAKRVLEEIKSRLDFLYNVGLGYLTLHRLSNTLSGGESQRIRLATSLGSTLSGSLYILDEPSIGLHPKDTGNLIKVLQNLRDLNNTVIVVEHEEEMMKAADHLIDIGPGAGSHGGELIFEGKFADLDKAQNSLTADYLTSIKEIPVPKLRKKPLNFIELKGVRENNLKNIEVKIPLHCLCVVTGVSGSGKTTLIKKVLYPALQKKIGAYTGIKTGKFQEISGKTSLIRQIELIDQNPLGRSSRSNPVTYVKAWDSIRELLTHLPMAKMLKLKPQHFSFNVDGGRCDHCKGDGEILIEMQFMADIRLLCEHCKGKRFKEDILEVQYNGKHVSDILELTVDDAIDFFASEQNIVNKLLPLQNVGLGYVKLGQSSNTLSGGEAQRVKLASFLQKGRNQEPMLFIFDEPTTGLHFHDISKLLHAMNELIKNGHSVVVIEHNMDVIKCADYVIDLGPVGGDEGGYLLYEGAPEGLLTVKNSETGKFLKGKL
jgi:excinuclease ABC subunit A